MHKFALENIDAVVGKQKFDKLLIDGKAPFDDFEQKYIGKFESEISSLYNYMNEVANLRILPETKFHPYSDGKDGCREFEFKTKHLRLYAIEQKGGKIIILGGTKAEQEKDQSTFWKYKKKYLDSLKK